MLTILNILAGVSGLAAGTSLFALSTVLFKNALKHDPDNPSKIAWFIEVQKNRSVVIQRGGRPTHVLRGDETPVGGWSPWRWYKQYVMKVTGFHVYFPFFTGPTVYDLPHYRVYEEGGKKVFNVVKAGEKGYRSNHVRTEKTTWYFEFSGAEIEKVRFTIKGSVQIRITKGKEVDALYATDSWNVLLDQALNSVIRGVVRRDLTLDMVIGGVENSLWDQPQNVHNPYGFVATAITQQLELYEIDKQTLKQIGIEILKVDIIDFEDSLTDDERAQLRKATVAKEDARAIELKSHAEAAAIKNRATADAYRIKTTGEAEAAAIKAKGEATAAAQEMQAEVHKNSPELAHAIIHADALRAFANSGGSIIDAVAATFVKNQEKK